ncbi:hypothetical protein E3Q16_04179 [Wallemia mellicola]|uniref:Ribokinase-like protein n=1 Tax=Wallemia mellicola TaxID=1708541 RepID=A0A4T0T9X5_9BASI|nr:hypothetical protein E3Q16_04179 [Wallemia mellicola]TIC61879.1 hypothetical protein E3Q01_04222 [Wallemia mellicola]
MGRILKVLSAGNLEFTTTCSTSSYPKEGSKVKSKSQSSTIQGASNILIGLNGLPDTKTFVYSQLGRDLNSNCVKAQLEDEGISTEHIHKSDSGGVPHTFIIHNTSNNMTTRFNHSNSNSNTSLPPLEFLDDVLQRSSFDWVHFDGQTTANLYETMKYIRGNKYLSGLDVTLNDQATISISCFSRLKPDIEDCLPFADVVYFNKEFVNKSGFDDARTFLLFMSLRVSKKANLYCIWDERTTYMLSLKTSEFIKAESSRRPRTHSRTRSYTSSTSIDEAFVAGTIYGTLAKAISTSGHLNIKFDNQKILQFATDMLGLKAAGVPLKDLGGILIKEGWFIDFNNGIYSSDSEGSI